MAIKYFLSLLCFISIVHSTSGFQIITDDLPENLSQLFNLVSAIILLASKGRIRPFTTSFLAILLVVIFILYSQFFGFSNDASFIGRNSESSNSTSKVVTNCLLQTLCDITRNPPSYGTLGTTVFDLLSGLSEVSYLKDTMWFKPYLQAVLSGQVASDDLNRPNICFKLYSCSVPVKAAMNFMNLLD